MTVYCYFWWCETKLESKKFYFITVCVRAFEELSELFEILIMDIYESKTDYSENIVTLTYDGKIQPLVVKQHMKKNYNCEHFKIISDREETTYMGLKNPAMCDVKILNCT